MHEKVEAYLREHELKQLHQKREFLIAQGLCKREYSPNNCVDAKYPLCESETGKYYREIPIDISEQEYALVVSCVKSKEHNYLPSIDSKNTIATMLKGIAFTSYVCGFILGIILGNMLSYEFSVATMLICWLTAFVEGTLFYSLSEIIKLLQNIKDK